MIALAKEPLFLFLDLYELTMAYGHWKLGRTERNAVFHLFFRKNPFGGEFSIACGLTQVLEFLRGFQLNSDDQSYLASLMGNDGKPLFPSEFLDYLGTMRIRCDIDAVPEGTAVFPQEPLVRVKGSLVEAQILETALLNIINFQTLIATKAARMKIASCGRSILEFGLRRAQGINGGLAASRAAYIGGCDATSNVLAGKLYGIPTAGTYSHSWVMSFDSEKEAFEAYSKVFPNNATFLVDTYDVSDGVGRMIETIKNMPIGKGECVGVRIDSGDLRKLSIETRHRLNQAGFPKAKIVVSGDLDEYSVAQLIRSGAPIDIFGIGTRLVTAFGEPALGGVYKLSAIGDEQGQRSLKVKISNDHKKTSNPGCLQIRRFCAQGQFVRDLIYDEEIVSDLRLSSNESGNCFKDLLVPVLRGGKPVYEAPSPLQARKRTIEQLASMPEKVKSLYTPDIYPVHLEEALAHYKCELVQKIQNR